MKQNVDKLLPENNTAFYVFDIGELKRRIAYLRCHLPDNIDLCYAIKANTFITREIVDDVERFELCSPGETKICSELGIPAEKTVISGVYKTPSAIEEYVAEASGEKRVYTVESLTQFELLNSLANKYNKKLKLLIRLTNDSQFGINANEIEEIIANRHKYPMLNFVGIQFFSGTQKSSVKKMRRELNHMDTFLCKLRDEYGYEAEEFEYGTGFPVAYFKDDEFDEIEMLEGFSQALGDMEFKTHITLELGRSIAASCGCYYTHIVDIKKNKGQNYILIDGGMHQLVYFGQHMAMKQPFMSVCNKENMECEESFNICGSLCSMNDIVAKQIPLPKINIGDVICFENTGAYCAIEGISLFLSRDIPAVYILREDGSYVLVRESFETMQLNLPHYEKEI